MSGSWSAFLAISHGPEPQTLRFTTPILFTMQLWNSPAAGNTHRVDVALWGGVDWP